MCDLSYLTFLKNVIVFKFNIIAILLAYVTWYTHKVLLFFVIITIIIIKKSTGRMCVGGSVILGLCTMVKLCDRVTENDLMKCADKYH